MIDDTLKQDLIRGYDGRAGDRERKGLGDFKAGELERFLARLDELSLTRVLEIGAGPGHAAAWLASRGVPVVATDLSPRNVDLCREKGLETREMSFDALQYADASFEAILAMSCLLHVPKATLPTVLDEVARVLKPGGLLYIGLHGGPDFEGPDPRDGYDPPRFFATYSDAALLQVLLPRFELWDFRRVDYGRKSDGPRTHYQSVIVRKPCVSG